MEFVIILAFVLERCKLKIFRDRPSPADQLMLLPPSVNDFVLPNDPVRVFAEILDSMDHGMVISKYSGGGRPAYDPVMMLKVLIFGYCEGIQSSRHLDRTLGRDVRFMYLSEMSRPDFRTISRFRRDNGDAIRKAFEETVRISQEMGLALLEHVSVDGTKLGANVSGRHTYRMERLEKALESADRRISEILDEAERVDSEEDARLGDKRGDELPSKLAKAENRKALLEKAKQFCEQTGQDKACATDLDSRVMKTTSGNRPAYNAQAVVDKEHQIIVAADVVQDESDNHQLSPMVELTQKVTGRKPKVVTVDCGYNSKETLEYAESNTLNVYMPVSDPDKNKHGFEYDRVSDEYTCPCGQKLKYSRTRQKETLAYRIYRHSCATCRKRTECCGERSRVKELWRRVDGELHEKMFKKMRTDEAKEIYRYRKQIVEPVFGNIKENQGLRRLLLRGLNGAKTEYTLSCIAHNIGKIRRFGQFGPQEALMAA